MNKPRHYLGVLTSIRKEASKVVGWIVTNEVGFGWRNKSEKDLVELRFANDEEVDARPGDGVVFEWGGKCAVHVARAICCKENVLLALSYAKINQYISGAVTGWRNKCDRHVLSLVVGDNECDHETETLIINCVNVFLDRFPRHERKDIAYGWMMDRWFSPRMKKWLASSTLTPEAFPTVVHAFSDFIPRAEMAPTDSGIKLGYKGLNGQPVSGAVKVKGNEKAEGRNVNTERERIERPSSVMAAERDVLHDMYLSKIGNRLNALDTPTDNDRKRWVWELLQNAKDSVAKCNPARAVNVEICIEGDTVSFSHDGEPFTPHCRNGLLYQYSKDKREQEGSTGRFGTGFMSTHCLSRVVNIRGDMLDAECVRGFEITIHREGQNDDQQLEGLRIMEESDTFYDRPFGKTTFTYNVTNDSGRRAIALGVEEVRKYACIVMLFCSEVGTITLNKDGVVYSVRRIPARKMEDGVSEAGFEIIDGESHFVRTFFYIAKTEFSNLISGKYDRKRDAHVTVAIEYDAARNVIVPPDASVYCVFPVIGGERQLRFPVLVNSADLELTEERDAVRLLPGEVTETGKPTPDAINRAILGMIPNLYRQLIEHLVSKGCSGLYFLAEGLRDVLQHEKSDGEWYRENTLRHLRSVLAGSLVAQTSGTGERIPLSAAAIVRDADIEKERELSRLISCLEPDAVGFVIKENHEWSCRLWDGEDVRMWTDSKACKYVAGLKEWNAVPVVSGECASSWHNAFLKCIGETMYRAYDLLPDMAGRFHSYQEKGFCQADHVEKDAFELMKSLGANVESSVMSLEIDGIDLPYKFNMQSCAAKINESVRAIIGKQIGDRDKVRLMMPLLSVSKSGGDEADKDFNEKRAGILRGVRLLFGEDCLPDYKDLVLSKNAWNEVDPWVVAAMNTRVSEYKNVDAMTKSETFGTEGDVIGFLNECYRLTLLQKIPYSGLMIFPNQHGEFRRHNELWAQGGKIDSQIEDIAYALDPQTGDFRAILMHADCLSDVQPKRVKTMSDVCGFVDSNIDAKSMDKRARSDTGFRDAVRMLLDDWRELHPELFSSDNFPRIYDSYNDLEIEIVHTAEERKLTNEILRRFGASGIKELLRGGKNPLQPVVTDVASGAPSSSLPAVVGVALSDGQYAGLSDDQKATALNEAKLMVQKELVDKGFVFENGICENDYSIINGVKKDGVEYPLVVHSYLSQSRQFQLSPADWEQLTKPNSMLWVRTQQGIGCVPFRELVCNREKIDLSFSTKNLDIQDRIGALASVMRWFRGLRFDFGSLIQPKAGMAQFFDLPEQGIDEGSKRQQLSPDDEKGVF